MASGVLDLAKTYAMDFMSRRRAGQPAPWAVDVHDGGHWVQVAGCPTKQIAKEAMAHLIERGIAPAVLRVRRLPVE